MNLLTKTILTCGIGMIFHLYTHAQETAKIIVNDSLKSAIDLQTVIISQDSFNTSSTTFNPLNTQRTDEVIEQLQGVSLIRRGNYAAEPTFRGMSSGQLSVTIDGMKIFGACTDKMDPVSSYVSSNNLESISVSSNSNNNRQGSNVGGGFDFQTKDPQIHSAHRLSGSAGIGYETNGNGRKANFNLNYSDSSWAINLNGNYQKFDNYFAGGNKEVHYTQFEKVNFSLSSSWMISKTEVIKAQLIYDDAFNVGYPALPMDVSFAAGRIYSLTYKKYYPKGSVLYKAYGNNITHIMDDTKRENVAMHMDMPGYSNTYGFFANGNFSIGTKHSLTINPDYYQNTSFADMTMYPNDPTRPEEPAMYMITWPDVKRHSISLLLADEHKITAKSTLKYSMKFEYVTSKVQSQFGIKQLEILGQDGTVPSTYLLGNGDISYIYSLKENLKINAQLGYSERQPTVSEGFGYYLFNSMDGYDYIGLPDLRTEKAFKSSIGMTWTKKRTKIEGQIYRYQFQDYIIGEVDSNYDGMTIGSNGVKVYENIPSASISGFEVNISTRFLKFIHFQNTTQYSYGRDNNGIPLQLIPPLQNSTKIGYAYKEIQFRLESIIAALQNNPRLEAGEKVTPAYAILNLNAQIPLNLAKQKCSVTLALNNIFDPYYWNHLDWNSIPRPGRSLSIHFKMSF